MIRITIVCDNCETHWLFSEGAGRQTATELRKELRADSWLVGLKWGRDYCPNCKGEVEGNKK